MTAGPQTETPRTTTEDTPGPAAAGEPRSRRRRRRIITVLVIVAFLALGTAATLLGQRTSSRPLAPDNPEPAGAMATAEILRDRGVEIHEVNTYTELLHRAGPGTTIFLPDFDRVRPGQYQELVSTGADLTMVGQLFADPNVTDELPIEPAPATSGQAVPAACSDGDATAASRIELGSTAVTATGSGVTVCFPAPETDRTGGYAVWRDGGATVRYLASRHLVENASLADHGHAALTLRSLGHHDELLWYLPTSIEDTQGAADEDVPLLPPAATWVLWALLAAAVVLGVSRARGLGPVVTELMPVVVRSAETTRGRGRLYRRSRARDHAAAALRAGVASRTARSLGLPRSATREALVDAITRATGRAREEVDALLYGTAPSDDAGLLTLSTMLDDLEREVHRT